MVSIIVVNYHTDDLVYKKDELCSRFPSVEFIVVDNSDSYNKMVNAIRINAGNIGYGRAINCAVEKSSYNNLLILNPDVILTSKTLESLIKISEYESYTCLTFTLLNKDMTIQKAHSRLQGRLNTIFTLAGIHRLVGIENKRYLKLVDKMYVEQPLGGCFMIRKDIFRSIEGFDSEYFVFWEDVDFFWRLKKNGIRPILKSDIRMVHLGSASFDEESSWKKRALEIQGRIIYFRKRKWAPPNLFMRMLELAAWSVRIKTFRNFKDFQVYIKRLTYWNDVV